MKKMGDMKSRIAEEAVNEQRILNYNLKIQLEQNLRDVKKKQHDKRHNIVKTMKDTISSSVSLSKANILEEIKFKNLTKLPDTANVQPFTSSKVISFPLYNCK